MATATLAELERLISRLDTSQKQWEEHVGSVPSTLENLAAVANARQQTLTERWNMIDGLVNILAFSLSNGENFLPDPASYDDLFYKLVETGDILTKFRDAFGLASRSEPSPIQTLINVSSHYHTILGGGEGKLRSKNLSPREVSTVIKQGYDTLSIEASEDLDRWEKFREADLKTTLKKIARVVVTMQKC